MKIGVLKETVKGEKRVSITPKIAEQLIKKGFEILIEEDAGSSSKYKNRYYSEIGAKVTRKADVFKNRFINVIGKRHILKNQFAFNIFFNQTAIIKYV